MRRVVREFLDNCEEIEVVEGKSRVGEKRLKYDMQYRERKSDRIKERIIAAYIANVGNLSKISGIVGISLGTIYRWRQEDIEFAEAMKEKEDEMTETAKAILYEQAVDKKNITALIFWLKNKTWEFAERKDLRVSGQTTVVHTFVGKSGEELEYFAKHGYFPKGAERITNGAINSEDNS